MKTDTMNKLSLITFTTLILVSMAGAQPSTSIDIELKSTEPTPLQTSEYADIWLEVENEGTVAADNVDIKFQENYPFSIDRGDRVNWSIDEIVPGETYQLHLQTKVDENAVQGENTLDFTVETSSTRIEEKVPVEVRSDRNVLSVENVEFPGKVAPGTENEMRLVVGNLADSQLKNIQVKLDVSSENLPFATAESSTKNIEKIEAGQSTSFNYSVAIDENAENGVYKLPVSMTFENEAGTEFEQSTFTGINIGGTPEIDAGLDLDEPLEDGRQEVTLRLVNKGHGSADFVTVELNETDQLEVIGSKEVYIGSMDSDDFQTASFDIYVDTEQESVDAPLEIPVQVSYSDQNGDVSNSQTVQAEVYSQAELQRYGSGSGNRLLPAAVVGIIVLGAGIYYWRKKRS
ncbi:COG1361 S-layer family protein [Candidatus Nanohalococcus occultus]|uniref:COG1361 S-layer family protein n=1 Tax=Candidatus Nanohalococcus occultus TaxID=2978047 RepID=UPI0039E1B591